METTKYIVTTLIEVKVSDLIQPGPAQAQQAAEIVWDMLRAKGLGGYILNMQVRKEKD